MIKPKAKAMPDTTRESLLFPPVLLDILVYTQVEKPAANRKATTLGGMINLLPFLVFLPLLQAHHY